MFRTLVFALIAILTTSAAHAETVAQMMRSYGLLGRWAYDCSKPATQVNIYAVYEPTSSGQVKRTYYNGPNSISNSYIINHAIRITDRQVAYTQRDNRGQIDVVLEINGERYHVQSSRASDGVYYVKDGKYRDGTVSAWQQKCRN